MRDFLIGFFTCWALLVVYGLSRDVRRYLRTRKARKQALHDLVESFEAVVH